MTNRKYDGEPFRDTLSAGVRRAGRDRELAQELATEIIEQLEEERLLGAEVLVQDRLGDAGLRGEVVHRCRVEAAFREHLARHVEELSPPLFRRKSSRHVFRSDARLQWHDVTIFVIEVARPEVAEPCVLFGGQREL